MPDHAWYAFVDASGSKRARVLNMSRLYIQGLHRTSEYGPIYLNNAWICLKNAWICHLTFLITAHYCWMSLNMLENAWINCLWYLIFDILFLDIWQDFECASSIKYARVLNMPQYSYNNIIIIVNNVIILEFLSAWLVLIITKANKLWKSCELWVTSSDIQVTSSNPRVTSSNPRVKDKKHELKQQNHSS